MSLSYTVCQSYKYATRLGLMEEQLQEDCEKMVVPPIMAVVPQDLVSWHICSSDEESSSDSKYISW